MTHTGHNTDKGQVSRPSLFQGLGRLQLARLPRRRYPSSLGLDASSADFALLANVQRLAAVRAVPLRRPGRNRSKPHAFEMEPFLLAFLLFENVVSFMPVFIVLILSTIFSVIIIGII